MEYIQQTKTHRYLCNENVVGLVGSSTSLAPTYTICFKRFGYFLHGIALVWKCIYGLNVTRYQ